MYHLKEFSIARRSYDYSLIKYCKPLNVADICNESLGDSVNYLISLDFSNIRKAIGCRMTCIDTDSKLSDRILYLIYTIINLPRSATSKVIQSTLLLIFISTKIKLIKYSEITPCTKILECSRFFIETQFDKNAFYPFPASFKVFVKSLSKFLTTKYHFQYSTKCNNTNTCITHTTIINTALVLLTKFKWSSLVHIPLFFLRAYCLRSLDNKLLQINFTDSKFETIGTVEPWQKLLSAHIYRSGGDVVLLQHGAIYDAIGEYQIYTHIQTRGMYDIQVKLDTVHLLLLNKLYNYDRILQRILLNNDENKTISLNESEKSFPRIMSGDKTLIFSSFYDEGMAYQTPFSLIYLIKTILLNSDPDTKFTIRLHPGDSQMVIVYLMRVTGIDIDRFDFDDNRCQQFNYSFGIPSTYYIEANKRSKNPTLLYGPSSKYMNNFNSRWIY